ncbi:hypothetical protein NUW54_g3434 [Trametes sanguinea]|uniref:Uncharacterized protein n=1 Tax=Trametes sanguinea TaxID=158606 RepID=A0ACC1Q3C4_9APHY|nr:hypothetical protein NUW54_g3434 [Trametes sanguinea]
MDIAPAYMGTTDVRRRIWGRRREHEEKAEQLREALDAWQGGGHQDGSGGYRENGRIDWARGLIWDSSALRASSGAARHQSGLAPGHGEVLTISVPMGNRCAVGLTTTSITTIIIIMVGVFFELPTNVREAIPESVLQGHLTCCPIRARGYKCHLLFRSKALFPHRTLYVEEEEEEWVYIESARPGEVMSAVPCVGSYCCLVLPDRHQFTGRITCVVEYQRAHIVLWVKHPYSPAIVTIAVPYPFYDGTQWWYVGLLRWFGYIIPDNDFHNQVVGQSPNIDWWELDDQIQGEFQYLYGRG